MLLDVGIAGVIVDDAVQMDAAPAGALVGAGAGAVTGDRVSGAAEPRQLGHVDVKQGAGDATTHSVGSSSAAIGAWPRARGG